MGADKPFLEVGAKPLIIRVIDAVAGLFEEVIISANDPEPYCDLPVRVVRDEIPDGGALVGLFSSLCEMNTEYAFAVACDMPFLSRALIKYMLDNVQGYDALVPKIGDYIEPLHAVYSRRCIEAIKGCIEMGRKQLRSFHGEVKTGYVTEEIIKKLDPTGLAFFNVNTPGDLERARRLLVAARQGA